MKRTTRVAIATAVASTFTAWGRWSPFAPEGVNDAINDSALSWSVALLGWVVFWLATLRTIKVMEGN